MDRLLALRALIDAVIACLPIYAPRSLVGSR
jgi:hypothetical protein